MIVSGKENVDNFKRGADNLLLSISEACEDNMTILSISTVSNDMIASEKENIVNFKRGWDNLSPSISEYCEETLEEEELDDTESESVNGLEMTDKSQDMFPELRHQKREKKITNQAKKIKTDNNTETTSQIPNGQDGRKSRVMENRNLDIKNQKLGKGN